MSDPKHVTDLMSHNLACPIKHQIFTIFNTLDLVSVKFRTIPMKAKDPCLCHYICQSEDEAKGLVWVDILSCHCNYAYGSWVFRFVDSEQPTKDL